MKSIQHKFLVLGVLPFLAIYIILSAFIVYQVYNIQVRLTKRQLHNMALHQGINLRNSFDMVRFSAQIFAVELEKIGPDEPAARRMGENVATSRFRSSQIINAWLIFEPNAFDGRDALHTGDYPNVPSGRYIRFFTHIGDFWDIKAIDETLLLDRAKSYWYAIPRETGRLFADFGTYELLRNYGFGPVSSFSASAPVFRNNRIIGCVGFDVAVNERSLGYAIYPDTVSAIFHSDGRLAYSPVPEKVGQIPEELGFDNGDLIRKRMGNRQPVDMYIGHSGISGVKSFNYFYPVLINDTYVYIYTSLPQIDAWLAIMPVLLPIGTTLFISLVIFALLFSFFSRGIAVPLVKLTRDSEDIVAGNFDAHIGIVNSSDEIGMISRSLSLMAEQFKTSKYLQARLQRRFDVILQIHYSLFHSTTLNEAFSVVLNRVSEYFGAFNATMVFVLKEEARIVALYPLKERDEGNSLFFAHSQVVKLLEGKKHLTMNGGALEAAQLSFVTYNTRSLCILPLRMQEIIRGYIIMEGEKPAPLVHDDTTLLFLGDTLSYLLSQRADWGPDVVEDPKRPGGIFHLIGQMYDHDVLMPEDSDAFLERAKNIQNLDVDKGILLIGGEKKKYTELLKITIKVISEEILKMRSLHTENLPAFGIEVHGMKSALYNIGAEVLGDEARQLEFAAKSGDSVYCAEHYPVFEEKLRTLSRNLAALFPRQERNFQKGVVTELEEALVKAQEASTNFDVAAVGSLLGPLAMLRWDDEIVQRTLPSILADMENLEYDGMAGKIAMLLDIIRNKEP